MSTPIDDLLRAAAADARVIGLSGGLPSEAQFPKRELALAFVLVLRRAGTPALQYGWAEGSDRLRAFVAGRLRARGADTQADDVIITSGAQQAIAIALELTARAGDAVGVGAQSYPAALELMRARRLVPVREWRGPQVRYVMPAVHNPRGDALTEAARAELLGARGAIIEDDAYAELRFDGPPPRPLLADTPRRVLHVGTLSKTLSPGLRIGWLVVPRRLRERAVRLKQGTDLQASSLGQAIAEAYLLGDADLPAVDWDARLVRLRRFYRRRATLLSGALRAALPDWRFITPAGGFAIWAEAPVAAPAVEELGFLREAIAEGVAFDPGSTFRPDAAAGPVAVRLCFSAAPPASFDDGARRLARAWRRALGQELALGA
ncbi:MAG TPA: PLP-dependent aminotransferase family protein [Polyangia bacterium]|nr:PLP-dependent aminotransferase family protein [Polyangia bacterium]